MVRSGWGWALAIGLKALRDSSGSFFDYAVNFAVRSGLHYSNPALVSRTVQLRDLHGRGVSDCLPDTPSTVPDVFWYLLGFRDGNRLFRANLYTRLTTKTFIHLNRIWLAIHQLEDRRWARIYTLFTASTLFFVNIYLKHIVLHLNFINITSEIRSISTRGDASTQIRWP